VHCQAFKPLKNQEGQKVQGKLFKKAKNMAPKTGGPIPTGYYRTVISTVKNQKQKGPGYVTWIVRDVGNEGFYWDFQRMYQASRPWKKGLPHGLGTFY
jgi:hypothetical protein